MTMGTTRTASPWDDPIATDERSQIMRQLLTECRARITPKEAGVSLRRGQSEEDGLNHVQIASLIGITKKWYGKLENGQVQRPALEHLQRLGEHLRMTAEEYNKLVDAAYWLSWLEGATVAFLTHPSAVPAPELVAA